MTSAERLRVKLIYEMDRLETLIHSVANGDLAATQECDQVEGAVQVMSIIHHSLVKDEPPW